MIWFGVTASRLKAAMARRRIGQDHLSLEGGSPRGGTSLEVITAMVDWVELDRLLGTSAPGIQIRVEKALAHSNLSRNPRVTAP